MEENAEEEQDFLLWSEDEGVDRFLLFTGLGTNETLPSLLITPVPREMRVEEEDCAAFDDRIRRLEGIIVFFGKGLLLVLEDLLEERKAKGAIVGVFFWLLMMSLSRSCFYRKFMKNPN